jgi:hypothetical protein
MLNFYELYTVSKINLDVVYIYKECSNGKAITDKTKIYILTGLVVLTLMGLLINMPLNNIL